MHEGPKKKASTDLCLSRPKPPARTFKDDNQPLFNDEADFEVDLCESLASSEALPRSQQRSQEHLTYPPKKPKPSLLPLQPATSTSSENFAQIPSPPPPVRAMRIPRSFKIDVLPSNLAMIGLRKDDESLYESRLYKFLGWPEKQDRSRSSCHHLTHRQGHNSVSRPSSTYSYGSGSVFPPSSWTDSTFPPICPGPTVSILGLEGVSTTLSKTPRILNSQSIPTSIESELPTRPFFSYVRTEDGTSLATEIPILRSLFADDENLLQSAGELQIFDDFDLDLERSLGDSPQSNASVRDSVVPSGYEWSFSGTGNGGRPLPTDEIGLFLTSSSRRSTSTSTSTPSVDEPRGRGMVYSWATLPAVPHKFDEIESTASSPLLYLRRVDRMEQERAQVRPQERERGRARERSQPLHLSTTVEEVHSSERWTRHMLPRCLTFTRDSSPETRARERGVKRCLFVDLSSENAGGLGKSSSCLPRFVAPRRVGR